MPLPIWIKEHIDNFFKSGSTLHPTMKEFLGKLKPIVEKKSKFVETLAADRTLIKRYSLIKKYVEQNYKSSLKDYDPKQIKADDDTIKKILSRDKENREVRDNFVVREKDVDRLIDLKDNKGLVNMGIYLLFVSGRRINELYKPIKVKKLDKKTNKPEANKNFEYVEFEYLSKQTKKKPVDVFLIDIKADVFISKLSKWRELVKDDGLTLNQINRQISNKLKKMFSNKKFSTHKLRGIYALVSWYIHGKEQNLNGFIKKILNQDSTDASLNYSYFTLELNDNDETKAEVKPNGETKAEVKPNGNGDGDGDGDGDDKTKAEVKPDGDGEGETKYLELDEADKEEINKFIKKYLLNKKKI